MSHPADVLPTAIQLRAAVSGLQRELRSRAPGDGPSTSQLTVLALLHRLGPLPPSGVARHERVKLQSLTRLLAEMEAAALVTREPDPVDARRTLLRLAPAGVRALTDEAHRREASLADAIATRLTNAERARLRAACSLLDRLAQALADAPATASH
ncbi:MarR family winged helix-turn-helix transcriptional regulator [Xenophilus aerolatus]|nr:MarR family transcriptional regulator [Xenophilus aerolatus]